MEIEIERIVLHGLDLTPERERRLRPLLESEVGRLLGASGWDPRGRQTVVGVVEAASLDLADRASDRALAGGLARRIVQTLRGIG